MRRLTWSLGLAAALVALPSGEARADISFIPLPAFGTSPNEGNTYGLLPVWLFLDQQGAVRRILAPSVTYNDILGINTTGRYFLFPPGGETIELIAAASTRGNRKAYAFYEDPRFGRDGRYYLAAQFRFERDPTMRFFGIGPGTTEDDETSFTGREALFYLAGGLNLGRYWRVTLTDRVRRFDVVGRGVNTLPFSGEAFPDVPGIDGGFVHAQRIDLTFDTRDERSLTTEGGFLGLGVEVSSKALGSGSDFVRGVVDGRLFVPVPRSSKRFVTVLRTALVFVGGSDVPFFEQASLGGQNTLRGFGLFRFTDDNSIVANIEERIRLFTLRLLGTTSEVEVAPFAEAGKVYDRAHELDFRDLAWSAGLGVRALVRPTVVGRIDIGVGADGVATYVGLGFPF